MGIPRTPHLDVPPAELENVIANVRREDAPRAGAGEQRAREARAAPELEHDAAADGRCGLRGQ